MTSKDWEIDLDTAKRRSVAKLRRLDTEDQGLAELYCVELDEILDLSVQEHRDLVERTWRFLYPPISTPTS